MGKRQLMDAPSARHDEVTQRADVPSVGTPAPPIDPDDVPGLMVEKPKLKHKNRPMFAPLAIIAVIVAMVVLGALSTVIVERRSAPILVVQGDDRIEPPATLPADTTLQGQLPMLWQPASLALLGWDVWTYQANAGETITISVHGRSDGFIPILGLYNTDGTRLKPQQEDRMAPQKSLTYKFETAGQYVILVGNNGGAAGDYDIMAQLAR